MLKNILSKLSTKRAYYIVFSLVASIALWVYVSYIDSDEMSVTVSSINVQFENEDVLESNDLVITDIDKKAVTLKFYGRRASVMRLSNDNVFVTVDLSKIIESGGSPGVYQLSYDVSYGSGIKSSVLDITDASVDYITVTVEGLVSKTLDVRGSYNGKVAEGYQAEPIVIEPGTITISGTQALVDKVDHAWVSLEIDDATSSVTQSVPVTLRDAQGGTLSKDDYVLSEDVVLVTVPIKTLKEVALAVDIDYGNVEESRVSYKIEPETVFLAGDRVLLDTIDSLNLGTIDLKTFTSTYSSEFSIPIPSGTSSYTGETTAKVTVTITGLETEVFSASNIQFINATAGTSVEIKTQSVDVTLRGTESALEKISSSNIRVVADLVELGNTLGACTVPAYVYVDGSDEVDAIGEYMVNVYIGGA